MKAFPKFVFTRLFALVTCFVLTKKNSRVPKKHGCILICPYPYIIKFGIIINPLPL